MTAQYPDYEISQYLTRKGWRYNGDNTWTSPTLRLADNLERIKKLSPLADIVEAQEIIAKLRKMISGDGIQELDRLCKILPDVYDYPRWLLSIKDLEPLVEFTVETEIAITDLTEYFPSGDEAQRLMTQVREDANAIEKNDEDSVMRFERIARNIRTIFNNDAMRESLNWRAYSRLDVFREQEIDEVIRHPIVWTRIDLRGNNTTQKNRFWDLLDLDELLPEKHPLCEDHLTDITQKHYNAFFKKDGLVPDIKANKISHEDALKRYDAIMSEEPEIEKKVKMTLRVDGREVFLDDNRVFVLPEGYDEKKRAKFLSRLNQEQVNFVVYPLEG